MCTFGINQCNTKIKLLVADTRTPGTMQYLHKLFNIPNARVDGTPVP